MNKNQKNLLKIFGVIIVILISIGGLAIWKGNQNHMELDQFCKEKNWDGGSIKSTGEHTHISVCYNSTDGFFEYSNEVDLRRREQ